MRKVLVIARREYLAAVRTKMFILSLVILPVLMAGSAVVQVFLQSQAEAKDKHFAVVDRTPGCRLVSVLQAQAEKRNEQVESADQNKRTRGRFLIESVPPSAYTPEAIANQRYELSRQVLDGKLFGILEIGPDVWPSRDPAPEPKDDRATLRYQTHNLLSDAFPRWAERVINGAVEDERSKLAGIDQKQIRAILQPVPLRSTGLTQRNPRTGAVEEANEVSQAASLVIPVGLASLMFVVVMLGANPLMQGVVEEKMQRIAEVLLGSVEPFELMLGKLIGMAGVSLTVAGVYLGGVYWAAAQYKLTDFLPAEVMIWFIIYQILAVLMYGSLFIAVGAACTDMKETQTLLLPVVFVVCLPLLALGPVVREPNSSFSLWLSFVPFATPMLMVARGAAPPGIAWWQPVLGVVLVLATTLACVYAAGRIFRVGLLMQGKGARMGDLVRWVVRG